jgi:hypothetical protein
LNCIAGIGWSREAACGEIACQSTIPKADPMDFRVRGLAPEKFQQLYGLADDTLLRQGVRRLRADANPGFPDRIELRDAEAGERLLLLNFMHQAAGNPYRSCHAIFVMEGANLAYDAVGAVPEVLRRRTLSLRAFDADDLMIDADLVEGRDAERLIERLLTNPDTAYIHAHYAKRGCYAARIDRV